jgi:GAF domain-containing protein/HAMP domain-containing protein
MDETKKENMENNLTKSAFWGTIALNGIMLLVFGYFLVFFLQQEKTPLIYIAMAVFLFALVAGLTSLVITIRGKQKPGAELSLYTILGLGIAIIFIFQGRAQTISLSIFTISALAILSLLPRQLHRQYWLAAGAAFVLMWVIEWIDPFWRIEANPTTLGPMAAAIFALILIGLIFYQARKTIAASLRLQIMVWTGTIIFMVSIITIAFSSFTTREAAIEVAQEEAGYIARAEAEKVKIQIAPAFETARVLASTLRATKDADNPIALTREQVNAILKKMTEDNASFLGTWTIWEPNAFDGLDSNFANTPLHDETGRFIPYWVRTGENTVEGLAIVDYETEGLNPYYSIPRETQQVALIPPYLYPVNGVDVLMTTISVPIVENGKFYGAVGVDYQVAFVQDIVDNINLFNGTANAVLLTNEGSLVAVRNQPELVLQPATSVFEDFEAIQGQIASGESFVSVSPDGQFLRVFAPVDLVSEADWSFALIIPFSEITATATDLAIREGAIGTALLLLALLILWYLSAQIVRPILQLTGVANAISQGNLNATANVRSENETGILANTFNAMTSRLHETLSTLEERVAARTRNLELAAEVGRTVSQVRALDVMLTDAAELIRQQFDLYYVQVYLVNPGQTHLNLQAGTGHVGEQLLARNHHLALDANSINGRAAIEKRSVVISDTLKSVTFKPNPLLPDTRSEIAVPLLIGDRVVGVLDMQSVQGEVLNKDVLPAFEALAGQLAIAIQNATFLAETQQARAEVEAQARRFVRANWQEYMDAIHKPEQTGFIFERDQVLPLTDTEMSQKAGDNEVIVPIAITGEALGNLIVELDENSSSARDSELIEAVARQVSQHVESLRLLETAERFRAEAEQATRRLTREGWQTYVERSDENLAFMYDLHEVRTLNNIELDSMDATVPLRVREEVIGKLAVQGVNSNDKEALDLVNAVAERLGSHIESLRQFDQTQSALAQSEKLFETSRRLTEAKNLQELTAAAVESINIPVVNRAIMGVMNYDTEGNVESLDIIANWWNGTGHQATDIGTHYPLEMVRMMEMFVSPTPLFFNDGLNDERVDAVTMQLVQRLNLRAVAVLPLHVGTTQIGVLMLEGEEPHTFTEEETRLLIALGPQIATVLDNRRQFERTQKQAEREAMLNAINQKIQSATSVESVLQIAARELGHALGAPMTVAQLSMKDSSSS